MHIYKFDQNKNKNKKTRHPASRLLPAPKPVPVKSVTVAPTKARILRPLNAFFLFRKHVYPLLAEKFGGRQPEISKRCGKLWKNLPPADRRYWKRQADHAQLEHSAMYPNYVYQPRTKRAAMVEPTLSRSSAPSSASSGCFPARVSPLPITSPAYFRLLDLDDPIPRISKGRTALYSIPSATMSPSTCLSLGAYNACHSAYSPVQTAFNEPLPSNAVDAYQHVLVQPDLLPTNPQSNASASPSSDWVPYETNPSASPFDSTIHETASSSSDIDNWLELYLHQPEDAGMGVCDFPLEGFSTFSPSAAVSMPSSFGSSLDVSEDVWPSLDAGSDVAMLKAELYDAPLHLV